MRIDRRTVVVAAVVPSNAAFCAARTAEVSRQPCVRCVGTGVITGRTAPGRAARRARRRRSRRRTRSGRPAASRGPLRLASVPAQVAGQRAPPNAPRRPTAVRRLIALVPTHSARAKQATNVREAIDAGRRVILEDCKLELSVLRSCPLAARTPGGHRRPVDEEFRDVDAVIALVKSCRARSLRFWSAQNPWPPRREATPSRCRLWRRSTALADKNTSQKSRCSRALRGVRPAKAPAAVTSQRPD